MENLDRVIELVSSSTLPMIIALLKVTIPLTLLSFSLGLVIAIITAVARLSNIKILKFIFATYVWIFRGTPLLVQLFIVFYGLPSIGVTLDTWSAATIAFSLNVGAYASESVRAAILSLVTMWSHPIAILIFFLPLFQYQKLAHFVQHVDTDLVTTTVVLTIYKAFSNVFSQFITNELSTHSDHT